MTIEQKSWLTTIIMIFLGYVLLEIPFINILIEGIIILICGMYMYENTWDFYNEEENRKSKKGVK